MPGGADVTNKARSDSRWVQGSVRLKITSARYVSANQTDITAFLVVTHGEDCDRIRGGGTAVCNNAACACRDPGITSYSVSGMASKTKLTLNKNIRKSGITDWSNWRFVPRGFVANIKYVNGNTILQGGKFAQGTGWQTPTALPGNTAGGRTPIQTAGQTVANKLMGITYDQKGFGTCTGTPAECAAVGFIKLTERCYSAVEAGSFARGDTFTGSYQCYKRGTNMAVTGTCAYSLRQCSPSLALAPRRPGHDFCGRSC